MKYPILTCLLIMLTGTLAAQTQTKRPSWSQGLPERQTTQKPGKPGFKPQNTTPDSQSQTDLKAEIPTAPDIVIDLDTQPELNFNIQPKSEQIPLAETTRKPGPGRFRSRSITETEINPLHQEYSWDLIKTSPIEIPPRLATIDILKVRIYINPNGQVIKVAAGAPDVPALMLKQAQQSIQNWQFEPPKNIGITDNIAKTFTLEIKAG